MVVQEIMILERLHQYMRHRNLSFNKLEISINASHGSISSAWKHGKNVGANVVERILSTYPEISAEWLLRGKGEMILASDIVPAEVAVSSATDQFNEILIEKCLHFFNSTTKKELYQILEQPNKTLEDTILSTWESKYGQELKSINRRLMTLFTAKLTSELNAKSEDKDSKAS